MKLTISKTLLKSALDHCNPIAPSKISQPAIGCALIVAKDGNLSVTVTNLDQRITSRVEAEIETEGETLIPFKRLLDVVDGMAGDIHISTDAKNVSLIECGKAKSKLMGLPAEMFVPPSAGGEATSSFRDKDGVIAAGLIKVKCAASVEESRMILNGVHFGMKDKNIRLECSDGRRAHILETSIAANVNAVVPTLACATIATLFVETECEYTMFDNRIVVESNSLTLESKLIEGNFPNVDQFLTTKGKDISVDKKQLLDALKFVSKLADTDNRIKFESKKSGIRISSTVNETGENTYEIENKQKVELTLHLNSSFLKDAISSVDLGMVNLEVLTERDPMNVKHEGFTAVIMTMRLAPTA